MLLPAISTPALAHSTIDPSRGELTAGAESVAHIVNHVLAQ
jgi:hypothetical protein